MNNLDYLFLKKAGRIQNARLASSLVLSGNIHDLFFQTDDNAGKYAPLIDLLSNKWNVSGRILIIYELNGPIKFVNNSDKDLLEDAWMKWRTGMTKDEIAVKKVIDTRFNSDKLSKDEFSSNLRTAIGKPAFALEFLRQICLCSRTSIDGKAILDKDMIIIIERADMLIPEAEVSRLSDSDRHRISVCYNWFSNFDFLNGNDTVVMLTESRSLINKEISSLPQIVEVDIPAPDQKEREHFINWFNDNQAEDKKIKLWSSIEELAKLSAGLSIHALRQLLIGACYEDKTISISDVIGKVESYIKSQLGEDTVEFKKPTHSLDECMGFTKVKNFFRKEMLPRFISDDDALSGVIICGPIGSGKTYLAEGAVSELGMLVLILKNIRSQYFGQTDVLFERIRRIISALDRVSIFLDEADTQLGGVSSDTHDTERRLTGKIQAMMSDSTLRGKVFWILMTARIHLLSPDIRRPGRGGDMIIPILDPEGADRHEFIKWMIAPALNEEIDEVDIIEKIDKRTIGYSTATFSTLRNEIKAKAKNTELNPEAIMEIIDDFIQPDIYETREYQMLQAFLNCTRKSLMPDNADDIEECKKTWKNQIRSLEQKGIN